MPQNKTKTLPQGIFPQVNNFRFKMGKDRKTILEFHKMLVS